MRLEYIDAGEIVSTHGVKGEMKLYPWVDGPELLLKIKRVRVDSLDFTVLGCRIQKNCNLLKLEGIDTVEKAQSLRGKSVQLYRDDLPNGLIFADELIGMEVFDQEEYIGKVEDVLDYPGNKVYVIRGKKEYMVPAVKQFVISQDLDANRMQVSMIEGMETDED